MTEPGDNDEYTVFVAAQPREYQTDLLAQHVINAYWLARRAGHDAETLSFDVRSTFARGAGMGVIYNRLVGLAEHPPITAPPSGRRHRRHPLPLPECAHCRKPYVNGTRMIGRPCWGCGLPLVLDQFDPNEMLPPPASTEIGWARERSALLLAIHRDKMTPDAAEMAMVNLIDEQHRR